MRRRRDNGEKGKRGRERRISKKTIAWDLKGGKREGRRGKGQVRNRPKRPLKRGEREKGGEGKGR